MLRGLYQRKIAEHLRDLGVTDVEPRIIEAWMRCQYGTLDGLSRTQFKREVETCVRLVRADTTENNEGLARSFGL